MALSCCLLALKEPSLRSCRSACSPGERRDASLRAAHLGLTGSAVRRLGVGADGTALLRQERYDWHSHIPNLDNFFVRLYVYFNDKGFVCSLVRASPPLPVPQQPAALRQGGVRRFATAAVALVHAPRRCCACR